MSQLGNLPNFDYTTSEWIIFKSKLTQFIEINKVEEDDKVGILITHISDESYRLLRNLAHPKVPDDLTYVQLVKLLDDHFKKRECTFADKAKFYGATRDPGESMGDWAARLRGLASYCDFGTALDTVLTDRFVLGLGPGPKRDKLFEQEPSKLKLGKAIELAEQVSSAKEAKNLVSSSPMEIKQEPVYRSSFGAGAGLERGQRDRGGTFGGSSTGGGTFGSSSTGGGGVRSGAANAARANFAAENPCAVCGLKFHTSEKCRFRGYRCQKCGLKGHLKKVCGLRNVRVNNMVCEENNDGAGDTNCCEECQNFNIRTEAHLC
ncbi:hypothetical protein NE865_06579 [Phthorimaea operculella]|nr:hypothetical protein NE865_06579 [Phthorimaea operculella]